MIVITGGAGFIGSSLLWRLNEEGINDIVVVDNLSNTIKWKNLVKRDYIEYIHRDKFKNMLINDEVPHDISCIVHLGANSSTTEEDCDFLIDNNVDYTKLICKYSINKNIRCIIASSAATYGDGRCGFNEDINSLTMLRPLNMYGYSKHLVDLWLLKNNYLGNILSLKFFNVYGPNEYHKGNMKSVVYKSYYQLIENNAINLFKSNNEKISNGCQKRDFIYVKDVVNILYIMMFNKELCGIHNVGTGVARTFNDLAISIFKTLNITPNINYIEMPENLKNKYQNYTCADIGWLKKYYSKFYSLEGGVEDYVLNYLSLSDIYL